MKPMERYKEKREALSGRIQKNRRSFGLIVLTSLVVVAAVFSFLSVCTDTAVMTLSLNYEQAEKGRNPNGTRFHMEEIKSQEVLERVIESAGLKDVTVEELAGQITIRPAEVETEEDYIVTSYQAVWKRGAHIGGASARELLNTLGQCYQDYFCEKYRMNQNGLRLSFEDDQALEDLDYLAFVSRLRLAAERCVRYLEERSDEAGAFQSERIGKGFLALKGETEDFIDRDLAGFQDYVTQNGLSSGREYEEKLDYSSQLLGIQYQKQHRDYQTQLKAVEMYDTALTAAVMVPTLDEKQNYYMSRTRVEIDYLSQEAKEAEDRANDILQRLRRNEYQMERIEELAGGTKKSRALAEAWMDELEARLKEISEQAVAADEEYLLDQTKNSIQIVHEKSAFGRGRKLLLAVLAAGGYFCLMSGAVLFAGNGRKNTEKRSGNETI